MLSLAIVFLNLNIMIFKRTKILKKKASLNVLLSLSAIEIFFTRKELGDKIKLQTQSYNNLKTFLQMYTNTIEFKN